MAITSSTVWTSKNQDLLKDPWKTSCCYRPFLLPLLPSAGSSDKTLWLWVHQIYQFLVATTWRPFMLDFRVFQQAGWHWIHFLCTVLKQGWALWETSDLIFWSLQVLPKETCHHVRWVWFSVTQSAGCRIIGLLRKSPFHVVTIGDVFPNAFEQTMRLLHLLKPIKVEQASTVSVVISKIFATDFQVPPMIQTCWWKKSG